MYKLKVNKTYSFDLSEESIDKLDSVETTEGQFHILQNNTSAKATFTKSDFNKKSYTVNVNNNSYTVQINDALDQQIETLGFEIGASKQVNSIKAPMPGLILEVSVKEGQNVKEDDALLILEAMKMENIINSPRDGVIKSIAVNQGETVDKNSLLIEFE